MSNIEDFFNDTRDLYGRKRHVELGFNAFSMVSEQYRKENFHSDILREILDPTSPHGAHCLFLEKFRDFLLKASADGNVQLQENLKGLVFDCGVQVVREKHKTDIAIVNEEAKWVIIIENKINGAFDMYRQLPRYYEYWTATRELSVKAILYLCAWTKDWPDTTDWTPKEIDNIHSLLIRIVGYSKDSLNLVKDWLEPCILSANSFDAKAVLSQYSRILIKQAGDVTMGGMEDFAVAMWENNVTPNELLKFITGYPRWLAEQIKQRFGVRIAPFGKMWTYNYSTVVLDQLQKEWNGISCIFAIDINCQLNGFNLSLFIRPNNIPKNQYDELKMQFGEGKIFGDYISIMKKFDMAYTTEDGRWKRFFDAPKSTKDLDELVNEIVTNLLTPLDEASKG